MKAITVDELLAACKTEHNKGNGKKTLLVSSDDEGNKFRPIYYLFTEIERVNENLCDTQGNDLKDCIILG